MDLPDSSLFYLFGQLLPESVQIGIKPVADCRIAAAAQDKITRQHSVFRVDRIRRQHRGDIGEIRAKTVESGGGNDKLEIAGRHKQVISIQRIEILTRFQRLDIDSPVIPVVTVSF